MTGPYSPLFEVVGESSRQDQYSNLLFWNFRVAELCQLNFTERDVCWGENPEPPWDGRLNMSKHYKTLQKQFVWSYDVKLGGFFLHTISVFLSLRFFREDHF